MPENYRFSPILDENTFRATVGHIAAQGLDLARKVIGRELPIDTLTIFSHDAQEHSFLDKIIRRFGQVSKFTHGKTLYIDSNFEVQGQHIKFLGLREPDPTKPEVGYADYPVYDYDVIQAANNTHIHEITSGRGQNLLEVRHPDFDVLGYIVRAADHSQ